MLPRVAHTGSCPKNALVEKPKDEFQVLIEKLPKTLKTVNDSQLTSIALFSYFSS